ncbi:MAG: hypothetical protein KKG59_05805 [Nanoarchaeota archaeon]|nr:hypothetical protein [Nanoarchaeota archaeon]MBU1975892.1 hypothetical protein [Nanoarchaeota archaeon]
MQDVTENEMRIALKIFKDFTRKYNANNLAKETNLTSMGVLKILNRLEQQKIIRFEQVGKAKIAHIDYSNEYAKHFILFLLQREAETSNARVKRWVTEVKKLQDYATFGVMFGSVLHKDSFQDVDLLVVLPQKNVPELSQKVEEINRLNTKCIHMVKQSIQDITSNLLEQDSIIVDALREGVVVFGYEDLFEVMKSVTR